MKFVRKSTRLTKAMSSVTVHAFWFGPGQANVCPLTLHRRFCITLKSCHVTNSIYLRWIQILQGMYDLPISTRQYLYLNYYLSFDVCVSFRGRSVPSFRLSEKNNFLMVAHIKNVNIISCQIFKKDKNGRFILDFFLDQICPKWIKLDQTWSNLTKLETS